MDHTSERPCRIVESNLLHPRHEGLRFGKPGDIAARESGWPGGGQSGAHDFLSSRASRQSLAFAGRRFRPPSFSRRTGFPAVRCSISCCNTRRGHAASQTAKNCTGTTSDGESCSGADGDRTRPPACNSSLPRTDSHLETNNFVRQQQPNVRGTPDSGRARRKTSRLSGKSARTSSSSRTAESGESPTKSTTRKPLTSPPW